VTHQYATEKMYCENCEEMVHVEQFLSDDLPTCPDCGGEELIAQNVVDNSVWLLTALNKALDILGKVPHPVFGDTDQIVEVATWFDDTRQFVSKLETKEQRS
jgi:NAD-dependent SIR2 family protein deacetylase